MNAERLFSVEFTRNTRRTPRLTYDARSLSAREPDRPQVSPKSRRKLPTTPTDSTHRLNVEFGQLHCTTSWDRLSSVDHRPKYLNVTPDYCPSPVRSPSPVQSSAMQKTSLLRKLHFQGRALMGQDQSKSSMTAFSNSFDSATVYQANRPSLAPRRADSTASDDAQSTSLKEPNRPIAGSTGSLQANSTGLRRQKKMSMERRSGSSTRSTSTNGMAKSQRTQSQSAKSVSKKNGISGSSQAIINFCIENAKGDVASRVVTRMANKREDFNQFLSSLNSENWNAFVGSLRDYFHAVVQNLQSSDKIKEISAQYGADQVPRRAWGFKADYFAVMASALTTECVFLDGAAHQPTEAIEAWAELAELMFSNIRDGYYQRIRYLRKNSHCFNQLFTQSSDQSTEDNSNQLLTPNPSPNRLSPNPNSKPPTDRRNSTLRTQNTLVSGDTVRS